MALDLVRFLSTYHMNGHRSRTNQTWGKVHFIHFGGSPTTSLRCHAPIVSIPFLRERPKNQDPEGGLLAIRLRMEESGCQSCKATKQIESSRLVQLGGSECVYIV